MTVINIAGMIGVGKTTLTTKLTQHLNSQAFFEPVSENPILDLYYLDQNRSDQAKADLPKNIQTIQDLVQAKKISQKEAEQQIQGLKNNTYNQYAFSLQIYFLNQRFRMIKEALAQDNNILDRSIYEDQIFTKINYENGNISKANYELYLDLIQNMLAEINQTAKQRPDLLIMLDASFDTILKRIKQRGRDFEQIENDPNLKDYYYQVYQAYQNWYETYPYSPKMKLDLEHYDLNNPVDEQILIQSIDDKLKELKSN